MEKSTVCLIFGGKSSEYEVSLHSAFAVASHIDKEKYEVLKLGITKDGEWYIFDGEERDIFNDTWWQKSDYITPVTLDFSIGCITVFDKIVYSLKPDIVFPVMHGAFGEDGRIQGALEMSGMKFVGCGSLSSAVCMDKYLTKLVAESIGVPCAKSVVAYKGELASREALRAKISKIGYPVFIKPCRSGSSVGISKVNYASELDTALEKAFYCSDRVIVEEAVDGKEVEAAVMCDGGRIKVSTLGEIGYFGEFYDYDTKYKDKTVSYIIPAKIEKQCERAIRSYCRKLFSSLECKGFCRMDFFVKKDGGVLFNEVNSIPGFTDISMFPKLFINDGYSFSSLIDTLITNEINGTSKPHIMMMW